MSRAETDWHVRQWVTGAVTLLLGLVIAFAAYWGARVDSRLDKVGDRVDEGLDELGDRVGNVEKDVAQLKVEVQAIKESNQEIKNTLREMSKMQQLIMERLPAKNSSP
ncbi:MAG: hypothetical protein GXP27_07310 [Planctomycetes bacterium]|nr:hypothetical protein [Planctomycetota bacterium]